MHWIKQNTNKLPKYMKTGFATGTVNLYVMEVKVIYHFQTFAEKKEKNLVGNFRAFIYTHIYVHAKFR